MEKDNNSWVEYFESDFGTIQLPVPLPAKWVASHPEEFEKITRALNDYMEAMWRNGFDF